MPPTREVLQIEAKRLRDNLVQAQGDMARVRDLLTKADAKLKDPQEDRRKWARVLNHLEASLLEARARHERLQVDLGAVERQLEQTPGQGHHDQPAIQPDDPAGLHELDLPVDLPAPSLEILQGILQCPLSELGNVTLEDNALLGAALPNEETLEGSPDGRMVLGRIELANQLRDSSDGTLDEGGEERRRQQILRAALDKIQRKQFDALTAQEIRMTLVCHALLARRIDPLPRDKFLLRILSAAIKILQRKNAEFHRAISGID